jgi:uncharacterized membrane protein
MVVCCNFYCGCFTLVYVCVCVGGGGRVVICVSSGNMCTCIYWVFVLFRLCMFSYFFCLYCHRVTTAVNSSVSSSSSSSSSCCCCCSSGGGGGGG